MLFATKTQKRKISQRNFLASLSGLAPSCQKHNANLLNKHLIKAI
jgi:hypothetical protein